jgi:hypothetical protein
MNSRRLALLFFSQIIVPLAAFAQPRPVTDSRQFADPQYRYSIRVPVSWIPYRRQDGPEPPSRLALYTPGKNVFTVSVSHLPRAVMRYSRAEFERIAQAHVDPVISAYLSSIGLTPAGRQTNDQSDAGSMRFWQGTSAIQGILVSTHAIPYESAFMINIVYYGGHGLKDEIKEFDAAVRSLVIDPPRR